MKKKVDDKTKLFLEFFTKELGAKFIDRDTGEEIEIDDCDNDSSEQD